ncbi:MULTISPECIES: hypothetical protein [Halorussus]|uniref:hypothetical protein n=1 Tax=Halorussus TaxID=1070314 RepID=UPI000E211053|nr:MULTISPECIES: hypothetical protein [Halorussus]NHN60154.1 hypothetical protein [Halorussus sp. JP-T4]
MDSRTQRLLAIGVLVVGAVLWLALSVYPFQYGRVQSLVLAGLFVAFGFFEFVLDEAVVND